MSSDISSPIHLKLQELRGLLRGPLDAGLIVAYSGGVDSAFLLWAAEQERQRAGGRLLAVTAVSASLAVRERSDAEEFARFVGVHHVWEETHELSNEEYLRNDLMRCYHCKTELFRMSHSRRQELGYGYVAYGYNASDATDIRPGHRAAAEQHVIAPLSDAALTKEEIRQLMRAFKLPLAEKPATPCLSSRLMTGVRVTSDKLRQIDEFEELLRQRGLRVFRIRLHEDGVRPWVRLEIATEEMPQVMRFREEIVRKARELGYAWITLDLAGYRTGGGVLPGNLPQ